MFKKKSFAVSILAFFLLSTANAQYYSPVPAPQPVYGYQPQYCYLNINPHSYACHAWTFQGSQMFPLNVIDWKNVIEGEWKTITYANPWSDNIGSEFQMMVSPQNNRIPVGVLNRAENTLMGSLTFKGNKAVWTNWRGKTLKTKMQSYFIADSYTFKFSFKDGDMYEQSFICRDFNRNNKHHLMCAWYLIRWNDHYQTSYTYELRGYFGFLRPSDLGAVNPPAYTQPIPVPPGSSALPLPPGSSSHL